MSEDPAWEPSKIPRTQVGRGNASCVLPDPPIPEGPSPLTSPLLPPSYTSRTNAAGGGPGRWRTRPGIPAGFLGPDWAGEMLAVLLPIL